MASEEFRGIYPAAPLTPMEYGLFSVAKPKLHKADDVDARWVRGFLVDFESRPNYARNWSETSATSEAVFTDVNAPYYADIRPYFLEVEDHASPLSLLGLNRFERVVRQLEGVTQRNIERELWEGTICRGESYKNPYLRDAGTVNILNSSTAISAPRALALLEHYITQVSAPGEQGVIHMTRDVATMLGSHWELLRIDNGDGTHHLETVSGTHIVLGAGYTGNGPIGATGATASDTVKWIYATGNLNVHLGPSEVVNDNLAQAYDVTGNNNQLRIKATRPAAAFFDTSIHLAVKVDLTL